MEPRRTPNYRMLAVLIAAALLILGAFIYFSYGKVSVVNPNTDGNLEGEAGITYAALYKHEDLYKFIGENEEVLRNIQEDVAYFARTTRQEFSNPESLIGFTVTKDLGKEGSDAAYIGRFYGVSDEFKLTLTSHGRGVFTLSIVNQKDQTNIDEFLSMNGARNRYIQSLPIEQGNYSIRYQLVEDRIVVSFYDGYTSQDVDAAVASLTEGLGPNYAEEAVFAVNKIGILGLDGVRQNLVTPIQP